MARSSLGMALALLLILSVPSASQERCGECAEVLKALIAWLPRELGVPPAHIVVDTAASGFERGFGRRGSVPRLFSGAQLLGALREVGTRTTSRGELWIRNGTKSRLPPDTRLFQFVAPKVLGDSARVYFREIMDNIGGTAPVLANYWTADLTRTPAGWRVSNARITGRAG